MIKRPLLFFACFLHRNLRYGNSTNRLFQFFVIRSRFYLKQYINKNIEAVNNIGEVTIRMKHAGKMKLYTNDYIDRWLFTGADFEPSLVSLVRKYLSKNDNFLDLGSNIGYFSLIASNIVKENGTVYAFEPMPPTIERLKANIALNKINNIQIIKKAASNKSGIVRFKTPSDKIRNSGRSSMRTIEENFIELDVEMVAIDSMLDDIKKIRLIKMDIEGAEALALEGMAGLISRDRPVIIMELSDLFLKQMNSSSLAVLNILTNHSYKMFRIQDSITELTPEMNLFEKQYDILCVPE